MSLSNRELGFVAPDQDGIVGKANDDTLVDYPDDRIFDRLACLLVDNMKDLLHILTSRFGL